LTDTLLPLVIVGAGGFGREVLELVRDMNAAVPTFNFLGFLDDGQANGALLERVGATILGPVARLADIEASFVIAIGAAGPRRRIDTLARSWGRCPAILRHPWTTVGTDVHVGDGAIVAAGTRLTTNVAVGRHAHVNFNCTIGHDSVIGDFATLFPGVHVSGGCVIEEGATLGTGCVIVPNLRVGREATIGAGAVVTRDVEAGTTVVGAAARPTLPSRPNDHREPG
jgi:sugar O-acyltransferase (sialic acid O-acetyltransferase NeuD family)